MVRNLMQYRIHKMPVLQIMLFLLQLKKVIVVNQVVVSMEQEKFLQMRLRGGINQKIYQIV